MSTTTINNKNVINKKLKELEDLELITKIANQSNPLSRIWILVQYKKTLTTSSALFYRDNEFIKDDIEKVEKAILTFLAYRPWVSENEIIQHLSEIGLLKNFLVNECVRLLSVMIIEFKLFKRHDSIVGQDIYNIATGTKIDTTHNIPCVSCAVFNSCEYIESFSYFSLISPKSTRSNIDSKLGNFPQQTSFDYETNIINATSCNYLTHWNKISQKPDVKF